MNKNPFVDTCIQNEKTQFESHVKVCAVNLNDPLIQTRAILIQPRYCRRCKQEFIPTDLSGTNARSFRCNKCLETKAFIENVFYSCTIS